MDTYTYFLLTLLLMVPWLVIFSLKKALRKKMLKASFMGGLAGFIAEYWYFKDYWQPATLLGPSVISVEDFMFGFAITGIAVGIYEFTFSIHTAASFKNRRRLFGLLFLLGVLLMMVFNVLLGINSIIVSCAAFMLFTTVMITLRPDLLRQAFLSGVLTLFVVVPVYLLLFNVISPEYWDVHWLLAKTRLGITLLGNIPLTELAWYFFWGCFSGTAYSFASGRAKIKNVTLEAIAGQA